MGDRDIMNVVLTSASTELRAATASIMHLQDVMAKLLDVAEHYERAFAHPEDGASRAVERARETLITTHQKNADGRWVRR